VTGSKRRPHVDPARLDAAAVEVASIAEGEHVRVALIGGYAMQHYGSERLTGDLDVAATDRIRGLPRGKALSFGGEQTRARNKVPVDVVVRSDDYADLYEDAIESAQRIRGVPLPVARPEHLAAMKMVAGRARDEMDLGFLISSGQLDLKRAKAIIKKHLGRYAVTEFERIVDETKWKASRGRI